MVESPSWFADAIAEEPADRWVEVDGAAIHYLRWGQPGKPGLLFIHGGAAHAHWWSHIAPLLLPDYCVAAIDLSGHGDSDRREAYSMTSWADEVVAVSVDAGFASEPVVIGHSMGGFVALATAARHCEQVHGIIIVDSPVREEAPEVEAGRGGIEFKPPRVYDDLEAAIGRFRTVPEQAHYLPYVKDLVARRSLQAVDGGHRWKFDPVIFQAIRHESSELLPSIRCRVALLRAEHGLVTEDIGAFMYEQLGRVAPVIVLPEAGHHPMLDVPLILLTALRSLVADWEHSTAHQRS